MRQRPTSLPGCGCGLRFGQRARPPSAMRSQTGSSPAQLAILLRSSWRRMSRACQWASRRFRSEPAPRVALQTESAIWRGGMSPQRSAFAASDARSSTRPKIGPDPRAAVSLRPMLRLTTRRARSHIGRWASPRLGWYAASARTCRPKTRPQNKDSKLTRPGRLWSFAAQLHCWADSCGVSVTTTRTGPDAPADILVFSVLKASASSCCKPAMLGARLPASWTRSFSAGLWGD